MVRISQVLLMEIHAHDVMGSTICADGTPAVDHPNYRCTLFESQLPSVGHHGRVSERTSGGGDGGDRGDRGDGGDGAVGAVGDGVGDEKAPPYLLRLHHYCLQSHEVTTTTTTTQTI